jgi:hypothetical protein
MSMRFLAGFVSALYNPLKVPDAQNSISATGGDAAATDFGDLTVSQSRLAACSNAHGGL